MPAAAHRAQVAALPALHVAGMGADDLDHRLDRVRTHHRLEQRAGDAETGDGERLGQTFAQAGRGAGVHLLEYDRIKEEPADWGERVFIAVGAIGTLLASLQAINALLIPLVVVPIVAGFVVIRNATRRFAKPPRRH